MKKAFTLAEVLITLAIIGVVAAISIPSVVANTQQKEFQTGLRKAVSVLNSAITMNMAIDGESPYENKSLYDYFQRHMSVMKSAVSAPSSPDSYANLAFYTTDGMRFEFVYDEFIPDEIRLYEDPNVRLRASRSCYSHNQNTGAATGWAKADPKATSGCNAHSMCGSYGLNSNTDSTINAPCLIAVDVNGDRKPFPQNASCHKQACNSTNIRKFGDPSGLHLTDSFSIMITDKQAIPYGQAAQKAMYQAQKGGK